MEQMWIKTQDGMLVLCTMVSSRNAALGGWNIIINGDVFAGCYQSEERANEVKDEIERFIKGEEKLPVVYKNRPLNEFTEAELEMNLKRITNHSLYDFEADAAAAALDEFRAKNFWTWGRTTEKIFYMPQK